MNIIDQIKLGNIFKVRELIASGINLNQQDQYGFTPLIWATSLTKPDIVELLLNAGADETIKDAYTHDALYWAKHYGNQKVIELLSKNLNNKEILTKKTKVRNGVSNKHTDKD